MSDGTGHRVDGRDVEPGAGCTKISPGCKHCYAETFAERFRGVPGHPLRAGLRPAAACRTQLELPTSVVAAQAMSSSTR